MRIHKLSPSLSNLIAAGEIVERPASVLKELIENSIDAQANCIEVEIEEGGIKLVRLRDNGYGIHKDDLSLAISSNATSKILKLDDLEKIATLGFRGEALASITKVTNFSLASRTESADHGYQIYTTKDNNNPQLRPIAHLVGTTIEIKDLFYNTPARRKFLRSPGIEFSHVEMVFKRIVLSHFDISFRMSVDNKPRHYFKQAFTQDQREQRIGHIFSNKFLKYALRVEKVATGMRLWGWIGLPSFSRSQSDLQFCYLNKRTIRDRLVTHAIRQSYGDTLYPGRQPVYLLFLEIDPRAVDVNVHPTKHEVRFQESRMVHDFIVSALTKLIRPTMHLSPASSLRNPLLVSESSPNSNQGNSAFGMFDMNQYAAIKEQNRHNKTIINQADTSQSTHNCDRGVKSSIISLISNRYLIVGCGQKLLICDFKAAFKQILYQKLHQNILNKCIKTRPLLVPLTIQVHQGKVARNELYLDAIKEFGFDIECFTIDTFIIRAIPSCLEQANVKQLILAMFDRLCLSKPKQQSRRDREALIRLIVEYDCANIQAEQSDLATLVKAVESHELPQISFEGHCIYKLLTDKQLSQVLNG